MAFEVAAVFGLIRDLGLELNEVPVSPDELARVAPDERLPLLWERLKAAAALPPEIGPPDLDRHLRVLLANVEARKGYRLHPYPGRVILLRASERSGGARQDPMLGWGELAAGGVEVHTVPGTHYTMLREPLVQVLAQRLKAIFTENGKG
jgi:thioesterase domain-containing protein